MSQKCFCSCFNKKRNTKQNNRKRNAKILLKPKTKIKIRYKYLIKFNRTACIRHQCRTTTGLSCRRCLINTGVEKRTTFKYRLELWPLDCLYVRVNVGIQITVYIFKVCCSISLIIVIFKSEKEGRLVYSFFSKLNISSLRNVVEKLFWACLQNRNTQQRYKRTC